MSTRILRGRHCWWLLGAGGVAAVPDVFVTDGELTPAALAHIDGSGLLTPPRDETYHLTVLTATACNLGCAYCFQNTAAAKPQAHNPPRIATRTLSTPVIDRITAFASSNMSRAGRTKLHILLFGGEPLLNPSGTLRLLQRAGPLGLDSAEMVTNGTLLTARHASRLEAAGLTRVQVTFDGDRSSHDTLRVTRAGRPTFDLILENVAHAARATSLQWIFRINILDPTCMEIPDLLQRLSKTLDPSQASISLHLIDDVGVGFSDDRTYSNWRSAAEQFAAWNQVATELGFNLPLPVSSRPCVFCSEPDGRNGAVINADGVLYSCWETAGKPGWEVGELDAGYTLDVQDRWVSCGYAARSRWSVDDQRHFVDHVDAANLDHNPHLASLR